MSNTDLKRLQPVKGKSSSAKNEGISFNLPFQKKQLLNDKIKLDLYKELSILISSGVDLKDALNLLIDQLEKENQKQVLKKIKDQIVLKGSHISDAIQASGQFTDYEIYSIKIGEEGGSLADVLKELSYYFDRKIKQRRIFINAISYPGFLLLSTGAVVIFMLTFVVPMFMQMFKQFDAELPYLTQLLIAISAFLTDYTLVFILIIAMIGGSIYMVRKQEWFRRTTSALIMKIPFLGDLIYKIYLARFCQSMYLLLKNKTSVVKSLLLMKKMIGFYPIECTMDSLHNAILSKGNSLSQALSKHPVFSKRMISLIKVAEEVNKLDYIFGELAKQYTEETDHQTSLISVFLQPIMLIVIGGIIGFIVVAMYLPMIELGNVAF